MHSTSFERGRGGFADLIAQPSGRASDREDNSQRAVLQELGLTLGGFLLVAAAARVVVAALGVG